MLLWSAANEFNILKYSVFFILFAFFAFPLSGQAMIQLLLHLLGFCWQKAVTLYRK